MGKRFVLIHGAWHGGWCWDGVMNYLEDEGHSAVAPTMPGHRPDDDRSGITYEDYVDTIVDVLRDQSEPVILVGHSSAGHMIQAAAPQAADKIEHIVFLNSFILADGACQFDLVPPEVSGGMIAAAEASGDNTIPVDEGFVRGALMADVAVDVQDELISQLVPQPLALFTTPVSTKEFDDMEVPITVLFCKDDQSLPPGAYLAMAENLPDYDLVEIDGGHETFYANPEAVAEELLWLISSEEDDEEAEWEEE